MVTAETMNPGEAAAGDAKAFLRIGHGEEDALVARLVAASAELCEQFTGQVLLTRGFAEIVAVGGGWRRLAKSPVRAITKLEALDATGAAAPLAVDSYAIDIDANGDGWVRVTRAGGARRVLVSYQAGLSAGWSGAPEALRQGVLRLAAHFYSNRDEARGEAPPAAVAALWRPWRRVSLAQQSRRAG